MLRPHGAASLCTFQSGRFNRYAVRSGIMKLALEHYVQLLQRCAEERDMTKSEHCHTDSSQAFTRLLFRVSHLFEGSEAGSD
jgi:hypothetical protein